MCRKIILLCLAMLMCISAEAANTTPVAGEALFRLLSPMHRFEATFQQTVQAFPQKNIIARAQGNIAWQRPHRFRWEIQTPNAQLILSDGLYLWIYDPGLAQAIQRPLGPDAMNDLMVLMNGTQAQLLARFSVQELKRKASSVVFTVVPKQQSSGIRALHLYFHKGRLLRIDWLDQLGHYTTTKLLHIVVNGRIPVERFRFQPPPGVDIIRDKEK